MDPCVCCMFALCDLSKASGPTLRRKRPREVLRPSSWTHRAVRPGICRPTELSGAGPTGNAMVAVVRRLASGSLQSADVDLNIRPAPFDLLPVPDGEQPASIYGRYESKLCLNSVSRAVALERLLLL
jgi:hypothetical protein